MKYGSVCSGVEAASVAWSHLNWEPQWFSEIDKFPSAVLNHNFPSVPNLGDMTNYKEWPDGPIDLLVGGTPCQSFSVAGLRKGLDDPRGNLMLTYVAIAARYKPRWLVWENVPGVLSSNGGRDFGTLLAALGQIGYGFAYRVLDAQYFGVAQRRRRVFVVGYLGDWRRAAAVLFERESLSGHPAPSREAREDVAGYTSSSFGKYSEGVGTIRAAGGDLGGGSETLVTAQNTVNTITASYGMGGPDFETKPLVYGKSTNRMRGFGDYIDDETASALKARDYKDATDLIAFPAEMSGTQAASTPEMSPTLSVGHTTAVAFAQNQAGEVREGEVFNTLNTNSNASGRNTPMVMQTAVAIQAQALKEKQPKSQGFGVDDSGTSYTLTAGDRHAMQYGYQVRRLTPIECERLQGFPDNYTQIPWRNKAPEDCPDGPRYKAMGNSMAVPVMRWIGERIQMVEELTG